MDHTQMTNHLFLCKIEGKDVSSFTEVSTDCNIYAYWCQDCERGIVNEPQLLACLAIFRSAQSAHFQLLSSET